MNSVLLDGSTHKHGVYNKCNVHTHHHHRTWYRWRMAKKTLHVRWDPNYSSPSFFKCCRSSQWNIKSYMYFDAENWKSNKSCNSFSCYYFPEWTFLFRSYGELNTQLSYILNQQKTSNDKLTTPSSVLSTSSFGDVYYQNLSNTFNAIYGQINSFEQLLDRCFGMDTGIWYNPCSGPHVSALEETVT